MSCLYFSCHLVSCLFLPSPVQCVKWRAKQRTPHSPYSLVERLAHFWITHLFHSSPPSLWLFLPSSSSTSIFFCAKKTFPLLCFFLSILLLLIDQRYWGTAPIPRLFVSWQGEKGVASRGGRMRPEIKPKLKLSVASVVVFPDTLYLCYPWQRDQITIDLLLSSRLPFSHCWFSINGRIRGQ